MSYMTSEGHRVPSPTDPAQRADLTVVAVNPISTVTVASETVPRTRAALQGAGVRMTDSDPAFVYRQDQGCIQAWNG